MTDDLSGMNKAMQVHRVNVAPLHISDAYMRYEISGNVGLYDLYLMREYASERETIWVVTIAIGRYHRSCRLVSFRVYTNMQAYDLKQQLDGKGFVQEEREMFFDMLYHLMNKSDA